MTLRTESRAGATLFAVESPGFDMIGDLGAAYPQVLSHEYVTIEVKPAVAGTEFWALVSVTDNETQTVGIISPAR